MTFKQAQAVVKTMGHGFVVVNIPAGPVVIAEKQIRNAGDLLAFLQSIDLTSVYLRNDAPQGNLLGNAQLIEETLTDGSKVRDIVIS